MKRQLFCASIILSAALLAVSTAWAQDGFQFGVIGHTFAGNPDDGVLRHALEESDAANLAFVVVNGVKSANEPCNDELYGARHDLLNAAGNGVIVSLAASDWVGCRDRSGSKAMERLNRMRDLFFSDEFSFGSTRLPLLRQSLTPKFRSYGENARWEVGDILFATINLPAANNHFLLDGGRNSEFEDRQIANRDWLHRLFSLATHKKMKGIVLFADGNPLAQPGQRPFLLQGKRDGFAEARRLLNSLTGEFRGKVLIVHSETLKNETNARIVWRRNLGSIGVASGWSKFSVNRGNPALFSLDNAAKPSP